VAQYYTTAGSAQTVRVLSQSQVVDVMAVGIYTKPSGVYVVVQVPLSEWNAGNSGPYLEAVAFNIEQTLGNNIGGPGPAGTVYASGAVYVQAVDPQTGLLSAFVDFTVSYTPPGGLGIPFTTIIAIPMTQLESIEAYFEGSGGMAPLDRILAAYQQLVNTAAL